MRYAAQLFISVLAFAQEREPIDLSGFADGIKHWQQNQGRGRNDPRHDPAAIEAIGANLLMYQNGDGGWPKDVDWLLALPREEVAALRGPAIGRSSFDNRNTYTQVRYLAALYARTGEERFRAGAERGMAYILKEQRPSGGWRGSDVDAITFNDDVTTGVIELLIEIVSGHEDFTWVTNTMRASSATALDRAVDCVLACQIAVDGVKTGWCQQHDHETFAATQARTYELPSICPAETTEICRTLMLLPDPSKVVVAAVDTAAAWLESVKIEGLRIERVAIAPQAFENHTATYDVVAVADPDAPPLWARFYEIESGRPFFCNRDGVKVYSLTEVQLERRTGYGWYGRWPAAFIETEYPAWRQGR